MSSTLRTLLAAVAISVACAAPAAAAPSWRLEQPAPPAGAPFRVALGGIGDLQFWAPNRGLLGVEGNAVIPRGLYYYDGESWRSLATVCGGPADTMRIAWAGPTEFWTVSEPSRPRAGSGITLCRFKDGQVVASYGTPDRSSDPYREMNSAACAGPNDCWFGGVGSQSPTGERVGAFHLHWDGSSLRTVYAPQGRGVSDIEALAPGQFLESVVVGRRREDRLNPVDLAQPEQSPALVHRITGETFANDPFQPAAAGGPVGGAELLALDGDTQGTVWGAGGGAASGPAAPEGGSVPRPPLLVRLAGGGAQEVPLSAAAFGPSDRLADVAAVPGTGSAWVTVVPFAERDLTNVKARVALVDGASGQAAIEELPASGSGRGAAARIAFSSATEGWLATNAGWLFHYTDGSPLPKDSDPAFARQITFRPNEAAEQFVPDTAPADDSQLFAPPPLTVEPQQQQPAARVRRLKALIRTIGKPVRRGLTIVLRFRLARRARVQLIAKRRGKVVARTRNRTFKAGRHTLTLRLSRKRWPTALRFKTKELTRNGGGGGGGNADDDDVVTTPSTVSGSG